MRLFLCNNYLTCFSGAGTECFQRVDDLVGAAPNDIVSTNQSWNNNYLQCVTCRQPGLAAKQCEEAFITVSTPLLQSMLLASWWVPNDVRAAVFDVLRPSRWIVLLGARVANLDAEKTATTKMVSYIQASSSPIPLRGFKRKPTLVITYRWALFPAQVIRTLGR